MVGPLIGNRRCFCCAVRASGGSYLHAFTRAGERAGDLSAEQRRYLAWAQAKADWLDPLVKEPDELLDRQIELPPEGNGD